jgi:hypothetical protein
MEGKMEIVVNKCFGGFGLSVEAEELYAKKSGFKLYRYIQAKYKHRDGEDKYLKVKNDSLNESKISFVFKTDHGDSFSKWPDDKNNGYWYDRDIERTDPILIEVVKELGNKSSGMCAQLEVVEIPDGVSYEIDEYDGNETVHETHRIW